jgi:hypothetical protein
VTLSGSVTLDGPRAPAFDDHSSTQEDSMNRTLFPAVLALAASPVLAEVAPPAAPGERVRVRLLDEHGARAVVTGRLLRTDPDSLTVQPPKGAPVTLPLARLERLERSLGRRSRGRGALHGAAFGLAGGMVVGASAGLLAGSDARPAACDAPQGDGAWLNAIACGIRFSAAEKAGIGAVAIGAVGAVTGGVVGAIAPGERWQKGKPERLRFAVGPQRGGVGASVQLRF